MAVTIPFIARMQVDIRRDVDEISARKITHWLMMFASNNPLILEDFRGGKIHYEGVEFWGSPADVYDQYISRLIEDFEERWIRVAEDALPLQSDENIEATAIQAAGLISSCSQSLLSRAQEIKGKLGRIRNGRGTSPLRLLPRATPSITQRLIAAAAQTSTRSRTAKKIPPWPAFVLENKGPIAAAIAVAGVVLAVVSAIRG